MGLFSIQDEKEITEEAVYHINAIALIFPYLRSIVSDLTSKGSESHIILPTLNIVELVNKQNSITKDNT